MSEAFYYSRLTSLLQRLTRVLHAQAYNYSLRQGVSLSEYQLLSFLTRGIPVEMKKVKNNLFVSGAFATNIANRLVEKELIKRHRSDKDRRRVTLALTGKGGQCLVKLETYRRKFFKALVDDLKEEDKSIMESGISMLVASLESMKIV